MIAIHPQNGDAPAWLSGALAVLMAALLSMASGVMVYRAATSANHWGLDIRWLWPVCVALGVTAGVALRRTRAARGPWTSLLVIAIATGTLICFLDQFNLLVEYNEWLRRGMP